MVCTYIGPLLKRIAEEQERAVNLELQEYKLTQNQARIILHLSDQEGGSCTQKDIETLLEVSHSTAVGIITSMERKRMVECFPSPSDRRMKIVRLIWGHSELYDELRANAEQMEEKVLQGFSEEERANFKAFLTRAYENLS